jgi:hypothetical protein
VQLGHGGQKSKEYGSVPVSKVRKKKTSSQVTGRQLPTVTSADIKPNPAWFLPVMLGLMVLGVLWIVTYYVTAGNARLPIPAIGNFNLAIGFALIIAGFIMATRWR